MDLLLSEKSTSKLRRTRKTAWFKYPTSRIALRWASAAAIIILIGIGAYLWTTTQNEKLIVHQTKSVPAKNNIAPGSNKAILTLSDGRKIELTEQTKIIAEAGADIHNKNGTLQYGKSEKVVFNTMTTPKGRQYKLSLPDGTNVWLNAASSITYPTAFNNKIREVSITGEAYFEVAKNERMPFSVKINEETHVKVLGTHFNINSYKDEVDIKTTLIEGSVKIEKRNAFKLYCPVNRLSLIIIYR